MLQSIYIPVEMPAGVGKDDGSLGKVKFLNEISYNKLDNYDRVTELFF